MPATRSLWDAELTRGLLDFVDAHKGPEGLFVNDVHGARCQGAEYLNEAFPKKDPGIHSPRQIESGIDRMVKLFKLTPETFRRSVYELGSMALNYNKLPHGTYSDAEMKAWRTQHAATTAIEQHRNPIKVRGSKRKKEDVNYRDNFDAPFPKRQSIGRPVAYAISTINKAADLQRLEEMNSRGELKSVTNKEHIKDCMKELCGAINLEENGIETVEPVVLDFEPRGQDLRDLIDTVAGTDNRTPGNYQSLLTRMGSWRNTVRRHCF